MSSTPNSILIIGAGELGMAVLQHLAKHTTNTLHVLIRPSTLAATDPTKTSLISHLRSIGITPLPGDIATDSIDTLAAIFKPFTTVVGCSGMTGSSGTQTKIATAVLTAGVKRYIPWQFGVDYDVIGYAGGDGIFSEQLDIRALLRGQKGTEWKIVSTGMFMSFVFEAAFGVVVRDAETGGWIVNALGSWSNRVTLTDVDDIGRCTAEVVSHWANVSDEIVYLAGDTVTYGQLADVVEEVGGSKVERVEWTVDHLKAELAKDPQNPMTRYRLVFAEGRGLAWNKVDSFNQKAGIAMVVPVDEGARRYLGA